MHKCKDGTYVIGEATGQNSRRQRQVERLGNYELAE
jgi:hypothetical protein